MDDSCEHVYIRLKAAVGLARQGDTRGYRFMDRFLRDEYLQNRLETVIVLGEINRPESCRMLINTLHDKNQDPEIRAGAAWSLGEIRDRAGIEALVESFGEVDTRIQVEAARALAKLARRFTPAIIAEFAKAKPADMPGISWALSKAGQFSVSDLLGLLTNDDARRWITYIIGTQGQDRYIHEIEQLRKKDTHVYFAVSVLWNVMASWIWGLEEY
jgi:HEAT repeat protein